MNRMLPQLRSLAESLIAQETPSKSSGVDAVVTFHVIEKLRPHMANLMGKGGFRALFARALVLASAEVSWLNAVKVNADGTLEGLTALQPQISPAEFMEGRVELLALLLGLLVALIGPDLTAALVADIWPNLRSTISLSTDSGVQSEKAK
jgi:hypothetical protein